MDETVPLVYKNPIMWNKNIEFFSLTHLANDLFTLVVFKPIKVDPHYNKP